MTAAYADAHEAVARILAEGRGGEWPLPVELPLQHLDDALRRGMPGLAFVKVREVAEGIVRVAWCTLLHEVIEWVPAVESLAQLPDAEREAVDAVLSSATSGAFTFGGACHVAAVGPQGIARPLAALAPVLGGDSLAGAWHGALAADKGLREALHALWEWRNHRFAHGFVGDADAYAALFDERLTDRDRWRRAMAPGAGSPLPALLAVLERASGWLDRASVALRALGWPSAVEAAAWAGGPALEPCPEPVAWRGGPRPLYLWDRAKGSSLDVVDVAGGESKRLPLPERHQALAAAARAALTLPPSLFGPTWGGAPSSGREERHIVKTDALLELVLGAVEAGHRRVGITGAAGAGKTVLGLAVERALVQERWAVVRVAAGATGAMDATRLPRRVQEGLERQPRPLRGVVMDQREVCFDEAVLLAQGDAAALARWWRALAAANPGRRFALILDGLDEWHAGGTDGASLLPPLDGAGADAFTVVLGYRSPREVAAWLRPVVTGLPDAARVDVQRWLDAPAGRALLDGYLAKHHPGVPPERRADVAARADGRFLWVYHYAQGLEAGFLSGASPAEWPAPDAFYGRYFAWLEDRMGGAPGYVKCLRRTLLTLSAVGMPVNDPTLAWLWRLDASPGAEAPEGWVDWFEPVLSDLRGFLVRGPVSLQAEDPAEVRAALVVAPDAARDSRHAVCRSLAHRSLQEHLDGGGLEPAWAEARAEVARLLADRTRAAILGLGDDPPEARPGDKDASGRRPWDAAPLRLAQQAFWRLQAAAGASAQELEALAWPYRALLPEWEAAVVTPWILHGAAGAREGSEILEAGSSGAATAGRGALLLSAAQLHYAARRLADAMRLAADAVAVRRALARLPQDRPPTPDELAAAIATDPGAVRSVAIALNTLGVALRSLQRARDAVAVHEQELVLNRALARLPQDRPPTPDELAAAIATDPGAVRSVAIALNTLGVALESLQRARDAVAVHEQELVLNRALARLPQDRPPTPDELAAAIATDPGAVREVAIAWHTLGGALWGDGRQEEAVDAAIPGVGMLLALLAPDGWSDEALDEAVAEGLTQAHELAMVHRDLGMMRVQKGDPAGALDLVRTCRLQRRVALHEPALEDAHAQTHGILEQLSIAEHCT